MALTRASALTLPPPAPPQRYPWAARMLTPGSHPHPRAQRHPESEAGRSGLLRQHGHPAARHRGLLAAPRRGLPGVPRRGLPLPAWRGRALARQNGWESSHRLAGYSRRRTCDLITIVSKIGTLSACRGAGRRICRMGGPPSANHSLRHHGPPAARQRAQPAAHRRGLPAVHHRGALLLPPPRRWAPRRTSRALERGHTSPLPSGSPRPSHASRLGTPRIRT